ncbi:glutamate 5-kinase, partial [Shouchella clausii]
MATGTIVIKIGSSSLTDGSGALSTERLRGHVEAICELRHQGINVIVVTSGAV